MLFPQHCYRYRIQRKRKERVIPLERIHGKPCQVTEMAVNPKIIEGKHGLKEYVQSLGKVLSSLQRYVTVSADLSLDVPVHHY